MKILHITDSHGTMKSPESRTDIYYLAFLKKMYELKYVIKQYNINLIIHTGDLFHTPRVSDKFTGALAEIIKSYGIPMYVVPGNHDIDGYSISTIDQTKLGLLYKTGVVRELDREHPIQLISHKDEELSVNIYGQEYYKDIDTGNVADYSIQDSSSADFNILAIHGYLCDKPQNPNIRHTLCQNIVTDADVILSGHFHESFSYQGSDFSAYNPGSLMRVEQNAYNQKHMPQYGILEINKQNGQVTHSYTFHQFKVAQPSDKVFDYTKKFTTKKRLLSIDNFKQTLAQTSANINSQNLDIENMIINTANASGADKFVYTKAMGAYDDASQASTGDKTFVVNGYTEDKTYKYITKVKIHNFQSHKDTTVEFKDGMNIIVGESNSGKTSILRAIRWVLDNTPKGSDFITSGEDECSVIVTFSDGTSIERTRTRNDAGEYRVHGKLYQPDGTITFWNQVYKGFNNDIPVDVCNTHQTPKVNLTKDISTHLNIMSQLDGPFLITESPLNKAAIIGRLAGSQIIDEAIKRVNRDILANSKAHKLYEEQLENKQYELKKYDDVDIEKQFINIATIIDDNISMRNARIMDINIKEQAYKNTYRDTIAYSNQYVTANLNAKALENVIRILNEQKRIYSLITKLNSYKVKETEVKNLTIKSKWLGVISLFNEFYGICTTKLLDTSGLVKTYSAYQENSGIISALTSKKEIIEAVDESGTLIENVLSTKNNNIQTGYNMYNQYLSMNASLNDINMEFQEASDKVDKLTESLDDIETEKDKVIKDNNICPCCGRKLSTKDQIHHVKNFMEEMLNGRTV